MDQQKIIAQLKNANIDWDNSNQNSVPDVFVNFTTRSQVSLIEYHVTLNGNEVVSPQAFSYKNAADAGKELCYAIFNIGNDDRNSDLEEDKQAKK